MKSLCGGAGELRRIQRTTEVKDGSGSEGRSAIMDTSGCINAAKRKTREFLLVTAHQFALSGRLGFCSIQSQLQSSSESHPADEAGFVIG